MSILPQTMDGVHYGMVFNNSSEFAEERGTVDLVWGSKSPNQPQGVVNGYYLTFDREPEPSVHNLAWYQKYHPDWIVYQCDRRSLATEYGDANVPIDIANPAVLTYLLDTYIYPALNDGYPIIDFDNVNVNNQNMPGDRCGVYRHGVWRYLYGGTEGIHGPAYARSVLRWAKFMYQTIHAYRHPGLVAMNWNPTGNLIRDGLLFSYLDVDTVEQGFTNFGTGYVTGARWSELMQEAEALNLAGKGMFLIDNGVGSADVPRIEWALATYLLAKGRYTFVNIRSGTTTNYGEYDYRSQYRVPIGYPLTALFPYQGIDMRKFSNGLAAVNPSGSQTFVIRLPRPYQELDGTLRTQITLGPHSGLVLLTPQAGTTS